MANSKKEKGESRKMRLRFSNFKSVNRFNSDKGMELIAILGLAISLEHVFDVGERKS